MRKQAHAGALVGVRHVDAFEGLRVARSDQRIDGQGPAAVEQSDRLGCDQAALGLRRQRIGVGEKVRE